ncbi:polyamine aminopropyltransferase [Psychrobium sp. 1_MG-2023]|uniref:polyamine aminopropyltransferase n=1 Tax=Psychrobium sp. 1_MG-2023 TaxID=3062624 RepID=UPI000C325D40|nr:polyamine aminopropyltransferase [Psychrobium sp. 1_MG-2023]MDP2561624.1 polyamine aminopropyltransferase [Psychrobium sp. 1_MG-2023]PKF55643.1 spermidine synthase [Alteromonadales bacterium alter-6D02]
MVRESHILLFSILIAGFCSIVYELLIATTGSYFLGDSITQFSLTIGIYMAFMGVGSYCSRWVSDKTLLESFIGFELLLALIGGSCVPLLYYAYAIELPLQLVSAILTAAIGVLIGLEIPLLSRLMEKHYTLKANLANVLSVDYFGALIATLVFPFILLPWLGVFKTSLAFGLVNLSIALSLLWYFFPQISLSRRQWLRAALIGVFILLVGLMVFSKLLNEKWNEAVYEDQVIHSEQSQYQQLVLTRYKDDIRLYLNGGLQFSSIDEYRYHESLVHPAMARLKHAKSVLILGGGDGLAVRELLKYPQLKSITVVDLDPAVAKLAKTNHYLTTLNQEALSHPKVRVLHQDGFVFLADNQALQESQTFDLVLVDLPDPKTISLARLYSKQFYHSVRRNMAPGAILVTQATSPFFAGKAFWSIHNTIADVGFAQVMPYHVNIPSFGEWGFVMACHIQCQTQLQPTPETRFYSAKMEQSMRIFPKDMVVKDSLVSTLDKPNVLYYYLDGWKYWN